MISGIHVSSSEIVINKDDGKKKVLPEFNKNQIIQAKILKLLPEGKALLLVDGQKVIAKTALLLKPGEEVQLKVIAQKDAIILKLIEPVQKMTPQQISSLVRFFSKNESTPDISQAKIAKVKDLLYSMALKSDKPDAAFLPRLIDKSGMVWEKKAAQVLLSNLSSQNMKSGLDNLLNQDLKGNILKELLTADPGKFEALKMAASFSETIENFQLLNHQNSDSGRFLLPFPILGEQGFSFGQLLIDTGDKSKNDNKEGDKVIHISFLLNMTRLGPLRADFSIFKKEITGRFLLNDDDTCQYVKSKIPELKTGLESIEYHVRQIDCMTAKKEDIQQSCFIETLVKANDDQVLNIVI
ncbi:MAG: hypothetical protein KKE44_00385 [Proteobacteria bacterium]|nr:hypothetical protein [Pseudomonadota bacterium]MBU1581184.1 hypothetical protein [Pseudomonadota bacterium]MBU2453909.1 hypothetical protein [Pseudomonadota bacterium]MBU2629865.1 hypothetical protein [Pseudomonadota bacterium]